MSSLKGLCLVVALVIELNPTFEPARLRTAQMPAQPPMTAGGGEVLLELHVNGSGHVSRVHVLRSTPPFTALLSDAVAGWSFAPARETMEESGGESNVASRVLVMGLFRPPTLYDAPARGEFAEDVAPPSDEVPFPTSIGLPRYPPMVHGYMSQSVLLEAEVGEEGEVTESKIIRSASGFDEVALEAARQWRFRPAHRGGQPVSSYVYVVFGFREPLGSSPIP